MPGECSTGYTVEMPRIGLVPCYPTDNDASEYRERYFAADNAAYDGYVAGIKLCEVDPLNPSCRENACMVKAGVDYAIAWGAARQGYYDDLGVFPP